MIRHYKIFYLALAAVGLGVISRHVGTIENTLSIPGVIEGVLPSARFWLGIAAILVAASLLPLELLFGKKSTSKRSSREFTKEELPQVAKYLDEMTRERQPDVPLIVDYTIFQAIEAGASDIHFDPTREGFVVRFRVDGLMTDIAYIPAELTGTIANRLKVLSNLIVYEGFRPQDGRLGSSSTADKEGKQQSKSGADFRIAFMPTMHGERIVIRILGRSGGTADFADLGMSDAQQQMMNRFISEPQGMIVLTGPTGSGKTTTIYAALRAIQDQIHAKRAISTLEDPIEYEISGINQSQVNDKKSFTFDKGLRAILRQDPDVIMVGEIRDAETAGIAIQAGMTGHLIISTVHANSSAATFSRLVEMGVAPYSLNTSVTAIIAQRLVRRICLGCRTQRPATQADLETLGMRSAPPDFNIFEGKGCAGCEGSGFHGRYALYEFLEVTEGIRRVVAQGAPADAVFDQAHKEGMTTLADAGIEAVKRGITTPDEVSRIVVRDRR